MPDRAHTMSPAWVVVLLSLLLGLQPVTTDLYLPALPALTQGFGASMPQAQLTLTALLLAFGLSQLVWGPVSDRFGRRPVLLVGVAAYVAASIACTLASSIEQLLVWRALQGVAMGAGVVCARAVVRDLYAPADGARVMSKGLTGLGFIACLSAPTGGLMARALGWRAALAMLAVFGAVTLACLAWKFVETLPSKNRRVLHPATLLTTWRGILRHPTFWAYALLASASYGGLFTFLAAAPFVLMQVLGLSSTQFSFCMLAMTACYIVGTFVCRRLLARFGVRHTVRLAGVVSLLAGSSMGLMALAGVANVWAIMVPFCAFAVAHGVHQPCGQSGAIGPFPQAAGAASALSGCMMMMVAFAMGAWLGTRLAGIADGHGSVLPLTNGIWLWSTLIAAVAWTLVQRHGEGHEAPPAPLCGFPPDGGDHASGPAKPVPRRGTQAPPAPLCGFPPGGGDHASGPAKPVPRRVLASDDPTSGVDADGSGTR